MPKLSRNKKVTNFVKGSIKYPFQKRLSLADKQTEIPRPSGQSLFFTPPPFRMENRIFYLPFNRIPHKTDHPYLRPKPYNSIELLILHEVRLLLISDKQKLNRYVRNTRESQTDYGHSCFMGTKHGYRGVNPSRKNRRRIYLSL